MSYDYRLSIEYVSSTPYQYVISATQENIDVRLRSMGLPAIDRLPKVDQLFLMLFLKHGSCLCVEETDYGLAISIKPRF